MFGSIIFVLSCYAPYANLRYVYYSYFHGFLALSLVCSPLLLVLAFSNAQRSNFLVSSQIHPALIKEFPALYSHGCNPSSIWEVTDRDMVY